MLKFETNGKQGKTTIVLPTKLEELTKSYLTSVTSEIEVSDNYTLIGVCYKEKLSNIIMTSRQNKPTANIAVVPIFIKSGETTKGFVNNLNTGDKLVIAPTQIALGHHVAAPNNHITISNFLFYCEGDKEVYQKALAYSQYVYFLEFKIIPNCDIIASYTGELSESNNEFAPIKAELN